MLGEKHLDEGEDIRKAEMLKGFVTDNFKPLRTRGDLIRLRD